MNDQPRDQQHAAELAALRREHPAYRIDREHHHSGTRYAATALALAIRPWCVIVRDPAELRSALTAPPAPPASHGH